MDDDIIEEEIKTKFAEAIRQFFQEGNKKRLPGFHISNIVYECERKTWYEMTIGGHPEDKDIESMYRAWIGTKLHETPITDKHEFKMKTKRNGYILSGTIDELMQTSKGLFLLDKKFVQRLPSSMYSHHRNQIMYYAVMLKDIKKIDVQGVGIVYFSQNLDTDGGEERIRVFLSQITPEILQTYREKLYRHVDEVSYYLKNNTLPPKTVSWYCDGKNKKGLRYCPFVDLCDREARFPGDNA